MKHLFYLLTIFPILWEMANISSPKKMHETLKRMKDIKEYDKYSAKQKMFSFLMLCYVGWTLVGFMSFQWPIFLIIILMSFIPKAHYVLRWIDSFITLMLLVFIMVNAYHLKIDTYNVILNYFTS